MHKYFSVVRVKGLLLRERTSHDPHKYKADKSHDEKLKTKIDLRIIYCQIVDWKCFLVSVYIRVLSQANDVTLSWVTAYMTSWEFKVL